MRLAHKVRKLFNRDIIDSGHEHVHRLLHRVSWRRVYRELERDKSWEALRRKYPRAVKEVHRFADTRFWIRRNVERAQDLSLDRGRRYRILDLGCGPGFFLYVAKQLGHSGVGIDIDEQDIFRDTLALLRVQRVVHRIQAGQRLPDLGTRFDLITSYLTCFHRIERLPNGDWCTWTPEQWRFFIEDIRANQLAPGGMMLLEFHPERNGELYSAEVREFFRHNRARLFRSKVFVAA